MTQIATPQPVPAGALAALGLPEPGSVRLLGDSDAVGLAIAVEAVGRQVDALRVAVAGELAERSRRELGPDGVAQRLGCRNAVELLQRATGASGATVNRRIRLGVATRASVGLSGSEVAPRFASVATAVNAGLLGFDAACAVVDGLAPALRIAAGGDVAVAEAEIVAEAVAAEPGGAPAFDADSVRLQATVWRSVLDPDGAPPSELDLERRGLRFLAPRHGLVPITGLLMPEVAGAFQRYADACTNPRTAELPSPRCEGALAGYGEGVPVEQADGDVTEPDAELEAKDVRNGPQKLHDVLAAMIETAARVADAPSVAGNAPTLVVVVRAEDLAAGRGSAFVEGGGNPLSMAAARQVGCAGTVQRIVLGGNGRILQLGSPERCFTGNQRRAIALRDGGCVIPGCHVPAGWCEVHHVVPHAHDPGGTEVNNGVLLCWYHHRTLDKSGWQVRMRDGLPEIKAPPWLDRGGTWRRAIGSPTRIAQACAQRGSVGDSADQGPPGSCLAA